MNSYTLCKVTAGPDVGKVRVRDIAGDAIILTGQTTSIRFQIYKTVPANPAPGPYFAAVDSVAGTFTYGNDLPPVYMDINPCVVGARKVKVTLVLHHSFVPTGGGGGLGQEIVEKIVREFPCPVGACP
jgi:hypothetical protein